MIKSHEGYSDTLGLGERAAHTTDACRLPEAAETGYGHQGLHDGAIAAVSQCTCNSRNVYITSECEVTHTSQDDKRIGTLP